jgi:hypothetical protein
MSTFKTDDDMSTAGGVKQVYIRLSITRLQQTGYTCLLQIKYNMSTYQGLQFELHLQALL